MAEKNLPDNRPLARAAIWFLVDAGIVMAVVGGVFLSPDLIPDDFDDKARRIGLIALAVLFTLLAITSSVLGFLANCRLGRTTGATALFVLAIGWAAMGAFLVSADAPN
jgi:hypothetical protein